MHTDKDIKKPDLRQGIEGVVTTSGNFAGKPPVTSVGDDQISPEPQVPAGQTTHE